MTVELVVGCWVRHRGSLLCGEVLEVLPQRDGTLEVRVDLSKFYPNESNSYLDSRTGETAVGRWWPSYHIDRIYDHVPTAHEMRSGRAWAPLGGLG